MSVQSLDLPRRRTAVPSLRHLKKAELLPLGLLAGGLLLRVGLARLTFLNPDEALHYALSAQRSLAAAYQASLTTVHPPLYILILHIWEVFGNSELILRLPSVLGGIAFCWVMYRWVEEIQDRGTALVCVALLLFLPSLVTLSAEIRQYSVLLLFASASLYFLDSAIQEQSSPLMLLSGFALCLALLTHYSAFIVALTLGIYALTRLVNSRSRRGIVVAWALGQLSALAICGLLYRTHISKLQSAGTTNQIADTWLRMWIFHPGQDHLPRFAFHSTLRLFRYMFSHGTIGVLALVLFAWGLLSLLRQRSQPGPGKPKPIGLAVLLSVPFALTLAASVAGRYPYGGTRHDALLVMFAIPGVSIGFTHLLPRRKWIQAAVLATGLLICNVFASPSPPYIPLEHQRKRNMEEGIGYLRQVAPPGALIFADHPAGLLLSYYLCHTTVVPFQPLSEPFLRSDCGDYQLVTPVQQPWAFQASTLSSQLGTIQRSYGLPRDSKLWLFQAGWIDSKDPEWLLALDHAGCPSPKHFGANILICDIPMGPHIDR